MESRQSMRNRIEDLLAEVYEVEKQMEDTTLSRSDQQVLDQAWEDLDNQIACLLEAIEMSEEVEQEHVKYIWGGEELPICEEELERFNNMEDDRVASDYYESDFGVYYNAADEV